MGVIDAAIARSAPRLFAAAEIALVVTMKQGEHCTPRSTKRLPVGTARQRGGSIGEKVSGGAKTTGYSFCRMQTRRARLTE